MISLIHAYSSGLYKIFNLVLLFIPQKANLFQSTIEKVIFMQFYKMYSQENRDEIEALIRSQPYCYLVI